MSHRSIERLAARSRSRSCRAVPAAALLLLLASSIPADLLGQPLTGRSPNLHGTWVTSPRNLHFQFAHRFRMVGQDADVTDLFGDAKVVNYPTFELGYGVFEGAMLGVRYSSNSLFAGQVNEWQPFVKVAPVRGVADGALSLSLMGAWNDANRSLDGELAARTALGPAFVLGAVRGFTDYFAPLDAPSPEAAGDEALALAGGAGVRLNRYLTLAADLADVVAGPDGAAAWSAGLHLGIPYTPHTVSLMATNVTSGTLAGASRGVSGPVFWGFEFTVPFSGVARWGRIFRPEELQEPGPVSEGPVVEVEISGLAFGRSELSIPAGTTVRWVNRDPVGHTATADDGAWGSPLIGPGETFEHTFEETGRHPYHCVPHPFMQAVVVVTEGAGTAPAGGTGAR